MSTTKNSVIVTIRSLEDKIEIPEQALTLTDATAHIGRILNDQSYEIRFDVVKVAIAVWLYELFLKRPVTFSEITEKFGTEGLLENQRNVVERLDNLLSRSIISYDKQHNSIALTNILHA